MEHLTPLENEPWLDMFLIKELTPMVVYTYYNKDGEPIYIGKSKDFYDRHNFHIKNDAYGREIKYVGFRLYVSLAEMEIAELYWIQKKKPKYNRASNYAPEFRTVTVTDNSEEVIVSEEEMVEYWLNSFIYEALQLCSMDHTACGVRKRNIW